MKIIVQLAQSGFFLNPFHKHNIINTLDIHRNENSNEPTHAYVLSPKRTDITTLNFYIAKHLNMGLELGQ